MTANFDDRLGDYNSVPERISDFRAKHPDGSLQPVDLDQPFQIVTVGDKTFVVYTAAAFRSPDDPRPGIGIAWEPFPGTTPYTRNSELQNAETSAWGRAIVAALAADAKKSIATREDVQNRAAMADPELVRVIVERVKQRDEDKRAVFKAKMAEHGISFTRPITQDEVELLEQWEVELAHTTSEPERAADAPASDSTGVTPTGPGAQSAGEGASQEAVESEPSPVSPSDDEAAVPPASPSSSESSPAGAETSAPSAPGRSQSAGGGAAGEVGATASSDDPEEILRLEEIRTLIGRFNKLELAAKSEAMALKRTLGITNWFEADPDDLAKVRAKVAELEAVPA